MSAVLRERVVEAASEGAPEATLAACFKASPAEEAFIEALIHQGEAQAHRALVEEQLGEAG